MGLFDLFRKKRTDSTFPENELEKTLIEAVTKESARKEFYQKLLWNELIVLTDGNNGQPEEMSGTLQKGSKVQLVTFEDGKIPVFTSTNRIFDKGVVREKVFFMAMKGQDLFEIARGAAFILNPYSDYGKELVPGEIESLLSGAIFEEQHEVIIEENTAIQIGQPVVYPTAFMDALSGLFRQQPIVKAAYIAAIVMDEAENVPHLLVAVDVEGELSSITDEAGPLAEKHLANEIVDFIKFDNESGLSDYFLTQTQPFYKRG